MEMVEADYCMVYLCDMPLSLRLLRVSPPSPRFNVHMNMDGRASYSFV